jgi:excisionase family DNA binding protein
MTNKLGTTKMLYSVAEAAILLSLSRGSVYKLIASGRLLAVYPTSQARISADALHRYVALLEKEQREGSLQLSRALA